MDGYTKEINENEFDGVLKFGYLSQTTGEEVAGECTISTNYTEIEPNQTYTVSRQITTGSFSLRLYDENKKQLKIEAYMTSSITTKTFTTGEDVKYCKFLDTTKNLNHRFKLEKGSVATEWTPYRS